MEISEYRNTIDAIDDKLLALLNERAEIALKIGESKFKNRILVLSNEREKEILNRLVEQNKGPFQRQHIVEIFSAIMTTSRNLQHLYQSFEDV